jgi:hypothetical protein
VATPADQTVCQQFFTVMGTGPATHPWTWLQAVYQSDPSPDLTLALDMTAWLDLMAAGRWAPGSGEQTQTGQAGYNVEQYCDSIHAGNTQACEVQARIRHAGWRCVKEGRRDGKNPQDRAWTFSPGGNMHSLVRAEPSAERTGREAAEAQEAQACEQIRLLEEQNRLRREAAGEEA